LAAHLTAQTGWEWRDGSGNVRSLSDLEEILREHRQWIDSEKKAGTRANLDHANLSGANLTGANLTDANLTNANLFGADLTGAYLYAANLDRAIFEPKSLPTLTGILQTQNLELLTYSHNPAALVQLRKQFEDGGLRKQERKITYALKRREAELSWARGTSRSLPEK